MITRKEMIHIVQSQLAIDLNCTIDDLNRENDSIVFVEAKQNPGCRAFERNNEHFEILSMGASIVVSATPKRLEITRSQMKGKDRDTIFALPFIRGLYLHFLPDLNNIKHVSPPKGYSYEVFEKEQVAKILSIKGYNNAIIYDTSHPYQTDLAVVAKLNGEIVGIAGATKTCSKMWQIGLDILPKYRKNELAVYLVNILTFIILERGHVPSYDCISSNIASQRVAHRVGYYPAWVSDWRNNFG